jgi:nucleotide-binding universal stress UspA family protein
MTSPVLITTDFSSAARRAYAPAVRLSRELGAPLLMLHVVDWVFPGLPTGGATLGLPAIDVEAAAKAGVEAEADRLRGDGITVQTLVRTGNVATELALEAQTAAAVVVATHGYGGAKGLVLGSTAARLVRDCGTPLLTVAPGVKDRPVRTILVPVDTHEPPCEALISALTRPRAEPVRVELYHTISQPAVTLMEPGLAAVWDSKIVIELAQSSRDQLDALAARIRSDHVAVTIQVELARRPAVAIADRCRAVNADLVVMTAHGTRGMARLLAGSVTEEVIRRAPCPVLTVRRPR